MVGKKKIILVGSAHACCTLKQTAPGGSINATASWHGKAQRVMAHGLHMKAVTERAFPQKRGSGPGEVSMPATWSSTKWRALRTVFLLLLHLSSPSVARLCRCHQRGVHIFDSPPRTLQKS